MAQVEDGPGTAAQVCTEVSDTEGWQAFILILSIWPTRAHFHGGGIPFPVVVEGFPLTPTGALPGNYSKNACMARTWAGHTVWGFTSFHSIMIGTEWIFQPV